MIDFLDQLHETFAAGQAAERDHRVSPHASRDDVTVDEKPCRRCGDVKPADAFSPMTRARSKDGLQSWCTACLTAYNAQRAARYADHPDRDKPYLNCTGPEHEGTRLLPRERFAVNGRAPSGRASRCKACA